MSITLIRVPSKRRESYGSDRIYPGTPKYDYVTPDGRWRVESRYGHCGYGHDGPRWAVIDTSGEYVCAACRYNDEQHAELVATLDVAREVIAEYSHPRHSYMWN